MALNDIEHKRCETVLEVFMARNRPPLPIRGQLDLGFRITGQRVEIFEIRPDWKELTVLREHPVAKATFVIRQELWKVYWMRQDRQWHRYEPMPDAETLDDFLNLVELDKYACFFG